MSKLARVLDAFVDYLERRRPGRPRDEEPSDGRGLPQINVYVAPGGEAEAGRAIVSALREYEAEKAKGDA